MTLQGSGPLIVHSSLITSAASFPSAAYLSHLPCSVLMFLNAAALLM